MRVICTGGAFSPRSRPRSLRTALLWRKCALRRWCFSAASSRALSYSGQPWQQRNIRRCERVQEGEVDAAQRATIFSNYHNLAYMFSPAVLVSELSKTTVQMLLHLRAYLGQFWYETMHIPGEGDCWGERL